MDIVVGSTVAASSLITLTIRGSASPAVVRGLLMMVGSVSAVFVTREIRSSMERNKSYEREERVIRLAKDILETTKSKENEYQEKESKQKKLHSEQYKDINNQCKKLKENSEATIKDNQRLSKKLLEMKKTHAASCQFQFFSRNDSSDDEAEVFNNNNVMSLR